MVPFNSETSTTRIMWARMWAIACYWMRAEIVELAYLTGSAALFP